MLQQLDIAIAMVVVLLAVSLLVTIATQMISAALNLRGVHLRAGLVTLLKSLEPSLERHAGAIVDEVLTHPLVSDSAFGADSPFAVKRWAHDRLLGRWRLASAIRPKEFRAALGSVIDDDGNSARDWFEPLKAALSQDPHKLLAAAQVTVDELKKSLPSADADRLDAYSHALVSRFSGLESRVDFWFDSAMDRVSQRFALNVRTWTAAAAVVVAFAMHFDVIALYNKMAADPALRSRLVQMADTLKADADQTLNSRRDLSGLEKAAEQIRDNFAVAQFQLGIPSLSEQRRRFAARGLEALLGILIGAALLSLGSPFWFNALKGLTSLKSTLASTIDDEDETRKTRKPAPAGTAAHT